MSAKETLDGTPGACAGDGMERPHEPGTAPTTPEPAASAPRVVARRRSGLVGAVLALRSKSRRELLIGGLLALAVLAAIAFAACGSAAKHEPVPPRTGMTQGPILQRGLATYYGDEQHGGPTASGERFDKRLMTAAHRTLPFGTRVRVTNTRNGRSVELRINDRGPFGSRQRIIDVSEAAARRLGMIEAGVVPVTVEVLK